MRSIRTIGKVWFFFILFEEMFMINPAKNRERESEMKEALEMTEDNDEADD